MHIRNEHFSTLDIPLVHAVLSVCVSHGKNWFERNCSRYGVKSPSPPISCNVLHLKWYKPRQQVTLPSGKEKTYSLDEKRVLIRLIISNDKTYSLVNTLVNRSRSLGYWMGNVRESKRVFTHTHTHACEHTHTHIIYYSERKFSKVLLWKKTPNKSFECISSILCNQCFLLHKLQPCSLLDEVVQFVSVVFFHCGAVFVSTISLNCIQYRVRTHRFYTGHRPPSNYKVRLS